MQLEKGAIIAEHYQLVKHLGDGSFGNVWLAHNLLADIDVAIKFYGTLDKKGLEDFRNEFKIAYRLHHPNLVNISHFDVTENCPYLVMPYCENGSLSDRVGKMPEGEMWKFLLDVSCGLAFLHSQQPPIVHQDIKPGNILVTSDGRYLISDFGISRSLRTQLTRTANNANMSGTIAYMGPERFSDKPMVVLTSDVWALGMTAYELMTGNVLWEGMGGCVQLGGARIPEIEGFSPELINLVKACLAPETWNRPTAMQIHEYAAAWLRHLTIPPLANTELYKPQPLYTPEPEEPQPFSVSSRSYIPSVQEDNPRQSGKYSLEDIKALFTPQLKKILLIAAAVIAAIVLLVVGGNVVSAINEEQRFVSCKTLEDYQQFIKDYPSSSYVESARRRIFTLTPQPARQQPRNIAPVSEQPVASAPVSEQPDASTTVSEKQPVVKQELVATPRIEPKHEPEPKVKPASQRNHKPKRQSADDAAFYSCHSARDYDNYLRRFPKGKHREAARKKLTMMVNH